MLGKVSWGKKNEVRNQSSAYLLYNPRTIYYRDGAFV